MSLKFCANLNFMFTESADYLERYRLAKAAGFAAVEGVFPPDHVSVADLVKVREETGLEQILINIALGITGLLGSLKNIRPFCDFLRFRLNDR